MSLQGTCGVSVRHGTLGTREEIQAYFLHTPVPESTLFVTRRKNSAEIEPCVCVRWASFRRAHLDRQGVATRGLPRGELRRRVRDRGAAGAAAMPPAVAAPAGGLLLAAMAKNSSRCTPRAYALSRREALAPRRGGRMRNDAAIVRLCKQRVGEEPVENPSDLCAMMH